MLQISFTQGPLSSLQDPLQGPCTYHSSSDFPPYFPPTQPLHFPDSEHSPAPGHLLFWTQAWLLFFFLLSCLCFCATAAILPRQLLPAMFCVEPPDPYPYFLVPEHWLGNSLLSRESSSLSHTFLAAMTPCEDRVKKPDKAPVITSIFTAEKPGTWMCVRMFSETRFHFVVQADRNL